MQDIVLFFFNYFIFLTTKLLNKHVWDTNFQIKIALIF